MKFALTTGLNGTVVDDNYTLRKFQQDNLNVSIRKDWTTVPEERLNDYNIFVINEVARPAPSDLITKNVVQGDYVWNGNRLDQAWTETDASAEEVAKRQQLAADLAAVESAKLDTTLQYLITHTPAEIYAKIQSDATDLSSAKDILGRLAIAVSLVIKEVLR